MNRYVLKAACMTGAIVAAMAMPGIGQVEGCTDPLALNCRADATVNDGSCKYRDTIVDVVRSFQLDEAMVETSGLVWWDGALWTHNDDTDTKLYALDTNGVLIDVKQIADQGNTDWEEITQDDQYLYIGDFGNNATGRRTDLHILRVEKASLLRDEAVADTIHFRYALQSDQSAAGSNRTDFDCEAFLALDTGLVLFTKEWISEKTTVYTLPKTPGNYTAQPVDTVDVGGLVTGATITDRGVIALCGYTKNGRPFVQLLYDYPAGKPGRGNKRRLYVDILLHQVEAIEHYRDGYFFLTNEAVRRPPFVDIPPKLHLLDLSDVLPRELTTATPGITPVEMPWRVFPNPAVDSFTCEIDPGMIGQAWQLIDQNGRQLMRGIFSREKTRIQVSYLPAGLYFLYCANQSMPILIQSN
jgi:hypothetical protein